MIVFSCLNLLIFLLIAILHFYWVLGGKWGLKQAIPQFETGEFVFEPGPIATLIVAITVLVFAGTQTIALGWFLPELREYSGYLLCVIAGIFGLRALGDFKYVGVFKKMKTGHFAENDTKYYTPLCCLISVNAILTYIML